MEQTGFIVTVNSRKDLKLSFKFISRQVLFGQNKNVPLHSWITSVQIIAISNHWFERLINWQSDIRVIPLDFIGSWRQSRPRRLACLGHTKSDKPTSTTGTTLYTNCQLRDK